MGIIEKNITKNTEEAEAIEQILLSKCVGVGEASVEVASNPNITAVEESELTYNLAQKVVQEYKMLLDADAMHISKLATYFDTIDRQMSNKE